MNDIELFRQFMTEDLASFAKRSVAELSPSLKLKWNWHLDLLTDRLQQLAAGKIQRLIINVPPRSLKSQLCTVIYPAWLLGKDPHFEILCISFSQSLGEDFARQSRKLMESDFYRRVFDTRLSREKRAVDQFETSAGGRRLTSSVGGTVTGRGGDLIILDDPMKPEEALSESGRKTVSDWVRSTLVSRPNSKKDVRMLLVMQRLHEDDVTAELLRQGGWHHVSLPATAVEREEFRYNTLYGPQIHVREPGDLLHPAHEDAETLARIEADMSPFVYAAQYRQAPMPAEGNILKRDWIRRCGPADALAPDFVLQSWDTASKTQELHDYSVCTTWAVKGTYVFLLDVHRERLELPALERRVIELADRYAAQHVLIEDKGSGTGLIQQLTASYFSRAIPIVPRGEKILRFQGVTPMFSSGQVLLPQHAPWEDDFINELCGYPAAKHDDQVDSTSQALIWLRERMTTPGIIEYYRQEAEKKIAFAEHRTVHLRAPAGVSHYIAMDGFTLPIGPDGCIWLSEKNARAARSAGFVQLSE
jgi:predicted phage terminase large subunit-like protein